LVSVVSIASIAQDHQRRSGHHIPETYVRRAHPTQNRCATARTQSYPRWWSHSWRQAHGISREAPHVRVALARVILFQALELWQQPSEFRDALAVTAWSHRGHGSAWDLHLEEVLAAVVHDWNFPDPPGLGRGDAYTP
jgi:hypothetical protein